MEKKQQNSLLVRDRRRAAMLFIQSLYLESTKLTPIPYSRFETLLNENKVERGRDNARIRSGHLKEAEPDG